MKLAITLTSLFAIGAVAHAEELILDGKLPVTNGKASWSPEQATGKPDTSGAGDIETAWASATPDGQDEWLELEYAEAVEPAAIIVHETYNPGALYRVTAYTTTGMEGELWEGKDPTPVGAGRGVSEVKVPPRFKTNRIRIHLKSKEVKGWNEIDAVGIKDKEGKVHWAVKAKASSTYGVGAVIPGLRAIRIIEVEIGEKRKRLERIEAR